MKARAALFLCALAACAADAQDGFGLTETAWRLTELNGASFDSTATLRFPTPGRVAGSGPCNSFFGALTGSYPAFGIAALGASKRACPDLAAEAQFFAALRQADTAERAGATLVLTGPDGTRLVFVPEA